MQKSEINAKDIDFRFLRNGDLVLRRGRSVESLVVYALDKNRDFSHVGIVAVEKGVPYIIHIVPDQPGKVRKELPEVFLNTDNASHFKIIRSDFRPTDLKMVAEAANTFYKRHLTFDNQYDLSTDNQLYCSELIIKAFRKNNICFPDIVPQKLKLLMGKYYVIMPGSFVSNSHFTCINSR